MSEMPTEYRDTTTGDYQQYADATQESGEAPDAGVDRQQTEADAAAEAAARRRYSGTISAAEAADFSDKLEATEVDAEAVETTQPYATRPRALMSAALGNPDSYREDRYDTDGQTEPDDQPTAADRDEPPVKATYSDHSQYGAAATAAADDDNETPAPSAAGPEPISMPRFDDPVELPPLTALVPRRYKMADLTLEPVVTFDQPADDARGKDVQRREAAAAMQASQIPVADQAATNAEPGAADVEVPKPAAAMLPDHAVLSTQATDKPAAADVAPAPAASQVPMQLSPAVADRAAAAAATTPATSTEVTMGERPPEVVVARYRTADLLAEALRADRPADSGLPTGPLPPTRRPEESAVEQAAAPPIEAAARAEPVEAGQTPVVDVPGRAAQASEVPTDTPAAYTPDGPTADRSAPVPDAARGASDLSAEQPLEVEVVVPRLNDITADPTQRDLIATAVERIQAGEPMDQVVASMPDIDTHRLRLRLTILGRQERGQTDNEAAYDVTTAARGDTDAEQLYVAPDPAPSPQAQAQQQQAEQMKAEAAQAAAAAFARAWAKAQAAQPGPAQAPQPAAAQTAQTPPRPPRPPQSPRYSTVRYSNRPIRDARTPARRALSRTGRVAGRSALFAAKMAGAGAITAARGVAMTGAQVSRRGITPVPGKRFMRNIPVRVKGRWVNVQVRSLRGGIISRAVARYRAVQQVRRGLS
ncbi:MAG TPA: hypothetical protein VLF91_05995 [Candidatus Saccharimonadales bacterium]|nr:hypothetical protein [Candidatus Saccharimonadales bacterium]